jgi:hypothetical protein
MSRLDRLMRPFAKRASGPVLAQLDQRLEATAARLEAHTVNLAEHQAQLRDESLRAIVNEMRSNSAFLADTAVALERAEGREIKQRHAAIRPAVHEIRASLAPAATVILAGLVDRQLVDELLAYRHRVIVVDPAMEYSHPPEVAVVTRPIADWPGPDVRAPLVVWTARMVPSSTSIDAVRSWVATDGWLVLAAPARVALPAMRVIDQRAFVETIDGLRLDEQSEPSFVVQTLRPS